MTKKLVVVSSFPDRGEIHSAATVGVASYTKNLLLAMLAGQPDLQIEVLAEKIPAYQDYDENRLHVSRCWQRSNFGSLWQLALAISARRDLPILLEFEINEFGSPIHTVFFLACLLLVRMLGAQITLVMHQVVGDFCQLEGNNWRSMSKNIAKTILYAVIKMVARRIIVFEAALKKYLGGGAQIAVIPHFVTTAAALDHESARTQLSWPGNKKYLLVFGYIAPYKGIKELLKIWPEQNHDWQLVIAGGANPNHVDNPAMMAYIDQVQQLAAAKKAILTGFVPEEKMPIYFAACDGMIFPYRLFMSSSGPLAWAFTYHRPVLLSQALAAYAQTEDFATQLRAAGLSVEDITYTASEENLQASLEKLVTKRDSLQAWAEAMSRERSIDKIATATYRAIVGLA